jgi:hypothetical protein
MSVHSHHRRVQLLVTRLTTFVILALLAARAAAAQAPSPVRRAAFMPPAGANVVTIVAHEYAYTMPDTIPAGLTTFILRDEGKEEHHMTLMKVDSGKTLADVFSALKAGPEAAPPRWLLPVGGPNAPAPGGMSNATLELTPGNYVALCMIPAPDKAPHFAHGMVKWLVVTPSEGKPAPLPAADLTITLTDYDFTLSKPLASGHRRIAITNTSTQPHELVISRYDEGQGNAQFVKWAYDPQGKPMPGHAMGGATALLPGHTVIIDETFPPGRYGFVCFIPDAMDGKPHFMHGMEKEFVIN